MAGRQMVFSKKGSDAPKGAPDTGADNNDPPQSEQEAAETVTCPECGCEFDPDASAEHASEGDEPKGAALEIPQPAGDAQAPIGEDAVTQAIAAVLAGHGGR